jgi:hypothetical protein
LEKGASNSGQGTVLFSLHGSFSVFLSSEDFVGFFDSLGGPFTVGLKLLQLLQLFVTYDGSTFREPAAAEEGTFLTLPDNKFAGDSFSFTVTGIVSPESLRYDRSSGTKKIQDWRYIAIGE